MIFAKNIFLRFSVYLLAFLIGFGGFQSTEAQFNAPPNSTNWEVETSLRYDALAFLGLLTGEDMYVRQYREEYKRFKPLVTPQAQISIDELNFRINKEGGLSFPAWLILYFSVMEGETLADLTRNLDDIDEFKARLQKTVFYSNSGWQRFMKIQDDLVMYFRFLEVIDFERYWLQEIKPKLEERMRAVRLGIQGFDAIGEVEYTTGRYFSSRSLTTYILYFNRPKGIRLTGNNFVVNNKW